jgi:hypothetical protein
MEYATIFQLSSFTVLPWWLLMIVFPHWRVTRQIIGSPFLAVLPALIYLVLVGPQIAVLLPALSNPTVAGIAGLLATPAGATIAWVHFLAFDLLIGRWAYLDAREHNISALLMVPVLLLTFMFGPIGYLSYIALRTLHGAMRTRPTPHTATPL